MTTISLAAARAEALFTSSLATGTRPTHTMVDRAVRVAVREYGLRGCAAHVATEYGDHPELAVPRMRWARDVVEQLYTAHLTRPEQPAGGWALVA
jgi:hypothetical protein